MSTLIDVKAVAELDRVKNMIAASGEVKAVLSIRERSPGTFLYLIETRHNFPRFVIGTTDAEGEEVHHRVRCGALWSAEAAWLDLTGEKLTLSSPQPKEKPTV